ncbi:MAG: hypothetical protein J7551_06860 [Chloroflexi bacterium]|nr:hypothetical protein [Chloroflexota bacterium]
MLRFARNLLVASLVGALLGAAQPAQATPLHAWAGNMHGWYPYYSGSAPMPSFADGPAGVPLGKGSFGVHAPAFVPQNSGSGMSRGDFRGAPLNTLSISYWVYNSDTSNNNWRIKLYINTTGYINPLEDLSANCALEYVHVLPARNTWARKVPTAARGGYTTSGGWVIRGDEFPECGFDPMWPNTKPGSWQRPASWDHIVATYPDAVIAPWYWTTILMQIYNPAAPYGSQSLRGAIDNVTINDVTWDFELEPPPGGFELGARYDPRPSDRLIVYCRPGHILVHGTGRGQGFFLGLFEFGALEWAGEEGLRLDRGIDGVLSASMGPEGHIWVAWTGGQFNATGLPEHGFAKLVKCG